MRLSIPADGIRAGQFGPWTLYRRPTSPTGSFLWTRFKLMLPPDAPRKRGERRAYYLAWSCLDARFAADAYVRALEAEHPELYAQVLAFLDLEYDPEWLQAQYDPAEIEAERARLKAARRQHQARERAARPATGE